MNRADYERLYESLTPEVRNEITAALEAARKGIYERALAFNTDPVPIGDRTTEEEAMNAEHDLAKRTVFDPYHQALKDLDEKYGIKTVLAVKMKYYGTPRSS